MRKLKFGRKIKLEDEEDQVWKNGSQGCCLSPRPGSSMASKWLLVMYTMGLQVGALTLFLLGFFPLKTPLEGHATFDEFPQYLGNIRLNRSALYGASVGHVVLVLIDAMRADFLYRQEEGTYVMQYLTSLITGKKACAFITQANPPTVTMPRIKALTTGGVPGFVDVVLNFNSQELAEDNLLTQARNHGKKMVFYGDDTWLRLFPHHFVRSEGTTSFFVTDYTEVDSNVTRHLQAELAASDWDILILHYLGLDHIGHLAGPRSPLINPKLREMDAVIKQIHFALSQQDLNRHKPSLIVVLGDHGMSDAGSHGGASAAETLTPLVMISSICQQVDSSLAQETISQVDVTPTLASLLGLPIPRNSLGLIVLPLLQHYTAEQQLFLLHLNAHQVADVLKKYRTDVTEERSYVEFEEACWLHEAWSAAEGGELSDMDLAPRISALYMSAVKGMAGLVTSNITTFDLYSMGAAAVVLWQVLLLLLLGPGHQQAAEEVSEGRRLTWVLLSLATIAVHCVLCSRVGETSLLCSRGLPTAAAAVIILGVIILNWYFIAAARLTVDRRMFVAVNLVCRCLTLGTVLHVTSLLSSSLIEEEHQTWYFFSVTLHLMVLLTLLHRHRAQEPRTQGVHSHSRSQLVSGLRCLISRQRTSVLVSAGDTDQQPTVKLKCDGSVDISQPEMRLVVNSRDLLVFTLNLVLHRLLRDLNHTGDKWSRIPDVGDWLTMPDHKTCLSLCVLLGLSACAVLSTLRNLEQLLFVTGLVFVYLHRATSGLLQLPGQYINTKGTAPARACFAVISALLLSSMVRLWRAPPASCSRPLPQLCDALLHCWVLLALLLHRPHNVLLVAASLLQELLLRRCLPAAVDGQVEYICLGYLWMGITCHFYQGNSNSLASVDISAAYVGLTSYSPILHGILLTCHTYSGWALWMFLLLRHLSETQMFSSHIAQAGFVLALSRVSSTAVYVLLATCQRQHLFVWSVFSPKLLYESMSTLVTCVFIFFLCVLSHLCTVRWPVKN